MDNFKVQLSYEQEMSLKESIFAIAEDNEKHNRTALYYLTSGAEGCYRLIKMCNKIIETRAFEEDHRHKGGLCMWYTHIDRVKQRKDWLPEKEKEIDYLYDVVYKSFKLYCKFTEENKIEHAEKFKKICEYIFLKYSELINYVLEKDKIFQAIERKDKIYHKDLIKLFMDVGKYCDKEVYFLLDYYIYNKKDAA